MLQLALIPLLCVASFVVLVFAGRRAREWAHWVGIVTVLGSLGLSIATFAKVVGSGPFGYTFAWLKLGSKVVELGLQADPLTAVMLLVIAIVSTMVNVYSVGYMHGDERYHWYYAVLSLFTAAMLSLVLANNYLLMYMSWEIMGLCSYLLIGFWFEKEEAYNASKKAFLVTRIGDVGFGLGVIAIFATTGTFLFTDVFRAAEGMTPALITMITLFLFCGAIGKSAQFPLHVWLPDAMAGPTPASALIHAATMVAAGVYLVARSFPLFELSETTLMVVATIGAITALGAALIAVVQLDIKKVLAYSTISQLGYMMMGLGAGSFVAGMWHLTTHAFFKALLFLGSGSVIHAVHSQDIREMGGLSKKMPITTWTFIIGSLALGGIFPLSGFFSKDEILLSLYHKQMWPIFIVALIGAFLTAFYMARVCFVVFFGKEKGHHAHESPLVMTVPLLVLAGITIGLGIDARLGAHFFTIFLGEEPEPLNLAIAFGSTLVALSGICVGWLVYSRRAISLRAIKTRKVGMYAIMILRGKFGLDILYEKVIVGAFIKVCDFCAWFDRRIIDGVVNGAAGVTMVVSNMSNWFDARVVDGIVNGFGYVVMGAGKRLRYAQSGRLQSYAQWMYGTLIVIILFILWLTLRGGL